MKPISYKKALDNGNRGCGKCGGEGIVLLGEADNTYEAYCPAADCALQNIFAEESRVEEEQFAEIN